MNLEQAYASVPKTPISTFGCGGRMPTIERDTALTQMERDVFSHLASVIPQETLPERIQPKSNEISFVSVEDAIKELMELEKQNKN